MSPGPSLVAEILPQQHHQTKFLTASPPWQIAGVQLPQHRSRNPVALAANRCLSPPVAELQLAATYFADRPQPLGGKNFKQEVKRPAADVGGAFVPPLICEDNQVVSAGRLPSNPSHCQRPCSESPRHFDQSARSPVNGVDGWPTGADYCLLWLAGYRRPARTSGAQGQWHCATAD